MTATTAAPRLPAAYWRLWWAAAVNNIGDGAFATAFPLLAVTITRDPRLVSILAAATYLPWLLLSLPVGAIVDRHDRVRLMWRSQTIQAAVVAIVAVLATIHGMSVPVLAVMAFWLGACQVVVSNSSQAILPNIVPKSLLHRANGNQYTVTTVGQMFIGPPLGSLLFAVAAALPFCLDAGSFALSAALLATLPRHGQAQTQHPPIRTAIVDGLRRLTGHRLLRTLALLLAVNSFCFHLGNVTLVLLATQTLHLSARVYGVLLAGGGIGSLLGGLVSAQLLRWIGTLPALLTSLVVNVFIFEGIGVSPNAIVLGALLALNGFVTTLWSVVTVSLQQRVVPLPFLGRVNGVYRMLGWGLIPLGALTGGLIAHQLGLRAAYPVAGALRGIALVIALPALVATMATVRPAEGPGKVAN